MTVAIIVAVAGLLIVIERIWPGRRFPAVAGWWPRALAINAFQVAAVFIAGATWERWLDRPQLFALRDHGLATQLAIGYAVNVMWLYWFHRLRHHVGPLWRSMHQLHHSPERIEILTAFYKHPLEIVVESVLSAVLFFVVLGLSPHAAFVAGTFSGVLGLFYHWNIATPHWLGYIVQRPESHCVHHAYGVHAFNYSELPIIDMAFGTFKNPRRFDGRCGFGDGRERRMAALLFGRDVGAEEP
jgi:sterol desaturase/sphingolipid hydroxylase (fatty acid hydroxylase superfamily)